MLEQSSPDVFAGVGDDGGHHFGAHLEFVAFMCMRVSCLVCIHDSCLCRHL